MVLSEERVPESGMMGEGKGTFQAAEWRRPDGASGCLEDASRKPGGFQIESRWMLQEFSLLGVRLGG